MESKIIVTLKKQLAELDRQRGILRQQILDKKREQFFTCKACKKKTKFKQLVIVSIVRYSYTDEDWFEQERQILCPKCLVFNRPLSETAKKKYAAMHDLFNGNVFSDFITKEDGEQVDYGKRINLNRLDFVNL